MFVPISISVYFLSETGSKTRMSIHVNEFTVSRGIVCEINL